MDQKYDEEREKIYEEVSRVKREENRMAMVKKTAWFVIMLPEFLYIFISALVVAGALALSFVTLSYEHFIDLVIQGDYGSLVFAFLFVALFFLIWLMFGVFVIWNDRHRNEIYEKVVRRQKR